MHPLEVRAIADGDAAQGIKGMDPISTGQLTREEIEEGRAGRELPPPAAGKQGGAAAAAEAQGPALYPGVAPP